jgi:hypothetical protein
MGMYNVIIHNDRLITFPVTDTTTKNERKDV